MTLPVNTTSTHPGRDRIVRALASQSVMYVVLIGVAIVTLVPLVYAFFASFKPIDELLGSGAQLLPETWTLDNYARAWEQAGFSKYIGNSLFVAIAVLAIDVLASSMLGYLLARGALPYGRVIEGVLAATLFIGVGTATLYPRYEIARLLGLDNLVGVVLVELSGLTVIHVFLVKAFCQSIPIELEEAARLDGCGLFRTFWLVAFPLMRPMTTTVAILGFQAAWNNFQIPYVFTLGSPDLRTLVVGVYTLRSTAEGSQAYDLMLAGAMLVLIPIVILFIVLQKYFLQGMTDGAVKG